MWIFWKDLNKTGWASSEYQESEKKNAFLELNCFLQRFLSISVTLSAEGWKINSDMEVAFLEVDLCLLAWEVISSDLTELQTFENCDWACAVDYFGKLVKCAATEGFSVHAWLANFAGKGKIYLSTLLTLVKIPGAAGRPLKTIPRSFRPWKGQEKIV